MAENDADSRRTQFKIFRSYKSGDVIASEKGGSIQHWLKPLQPTNVFLKNKMLLVLNKRAMSNIPTNFTPLVRFFIPGGINNCNTISGEILKINV